MPKPRTKVREIKKNVKITEIKKDEFSLEDRVRLEASSPIIESTRAVNPTLSQHFIPSFSQETRKEVREGIQSKDREFSYSSMMSQPTRSYDPSIKSARTQFMEAQPSSGGRVNPTLRDSSPIQNQTGPSTILDEHQSGIEPSLRKLRDSEPDYRVEKSVEKYMSKRRSDI